MAVGGPLAMAVSSRLWGLAEMVQFWSWLCPELCYCRRRAWDTWDTDNGEGDLPEIRLSVSQPRQWVLILWCTLPGCCGLLSQGLNFALWNNPFFPIGIFSADFHSGERQTLPRCMELKGKTKMQNWSHRAGPLTEASWIMTSLKKEIREFTNTQEF